MLNQLVCVGRLVNDPELAETENGAKFANITLAVPRPYKNESGEYDTDFIDVTIFNQVATSTSEYCKKGDLIGIKGRLEQHKYQDKNDKTISKLQVIAEKISFLSSRSDKERYAEER